MATQKQRTAARRNIKKAASAAKSKRTLANLPKKTRTALGKQGAAVAARKRTGAKTPHTRQELYEEARRKGLPGRSKMGRADLVRALGHE
jgi:L,D-peptidoglycan transpeptidase YkuD (ErfK/YbiS/YcfS/YnhG family)